MIVPVQHGRSQLNGRADGQGDGRTRFDDDTVRRLRHRDVRVRLNIPRTGRDACRPVTRRGHQALAGIHRRDSRVSARPHHQSGGHDHIVLVIDCGGKFLCLANGVESDGCWDYYDPGRYLLRRRGWRWSSRRAGLCGTVFAARGTCEQSQMYKDHNKTAMHAVHDS